MVEALAEWSGAVLHAPLDGLPVAHPGHIDVVYDSIAKAETLEVGVRVLAERGRLVYTGVATPERWESTPIYFKELTIAGSNAFGMEDFEGRRLHAIAHYLATGRGRPGRHHAHADAPLRARGVVARPEGPGPAGPQRRPQGGVHAQPVGAPAPEPPPVRTPVVPVGAQLARASADAASELTLIVSVYGPKVSVEVPNDAVSPVGARPRRYSR